MVLIKNAVVTSKGYQYLKAQYYTIFIKFINEINEFTFFNCKTNYQVLDLHYEK
jgi:hypothetical protein